jgi:hypothetical protein
MKVRDLTAGQIEAIRQRFITDEDPGLIAFDFALDSKQVSDLAYRRKWKAEKTKVREVLAEKTPEAVAVRLIANATDYITQHTDDWQTIRTAIMAVIEAEQDPLEKAKMSAACYKALEAIQKGQRLSLGLGVGEAPPTDPVKNEQPDFRNMDPAERRRRIDEKIRASRRSGG